MSSSSGSADADLPLKPIPGGYGLPFIGAVCDRFDFFYLQGSDDFFRSRMLKYKSTVFRTNMPPGPFISPNSRVIALLDAASFPVLFDNSKVEKRDVFTGTFKPSAGFTNGYRVCNYLDPSEPKHDQIKSFLLALIASRKDQVIPLLRNYLTELFIKVEDEVSGHGKVYFNPISQNELFNFLFHLYCGKAPVQTKLKSDGLKLFQLWVFAQVLPLGSLGLPWYLFPLSVLEDLLLHTLPLPSFLLKWDLNKLYNAVETSATEAFDLASTFGLSKDEACMNLLFVLGFNSCNGMKIVIPTLMKWVGLAGKTLHQKIADEVRSVVKEEGGVTLKAMEKMPLVKSVVWESLRIEPPVAYQYAKAKEDIVVRSHDAAFLVKKGETLLGFQPFATKDEKVFKDAERFVEDRFMGEEGEKLLRYVYWSNGRETEEPAAANKQCAGKNLVELVLRIFTAEFFLRYDSFTIKLGKPTLQGPTVTITSLVKASTL
ncbi:allene oxide synthase 3-like [Neltuma alba]|uniref:allene oxide synthase 3-like n=1 Tax=Neltuma alba TaxID=207710 RepID=UPI0010A3D9E7|nr:allene oxide synthase 3-like [Prosopis alba]